MKSPFGLSLSLVLAAGALSLAPARADDPSSPPVPPPAPAGPDTTPGSGETPAPGGHRHRRPAFVLAELTEKLGLTADQQKTVGAIIADADGQLRALRGDDSLSGPDKRAKMRSILETARGQIRAALTPDQQKVFDTLPTRGERGGHGGQPESPTPTPTS